MRRQPIVHWFRPGGFVRSREVPERSLMAVGAEPVRHSFLVTALYNQ